MTPNFKDASDHLGYVLNADALLTTGHSFLDPIRPDPLCR